jgi:putative membrane protein
MKKNNYDFTQPTRQSYVAILMILYRTFIVIFRQALPVVVVVLLGRNEKAGSRVLFIFIGIAILSMMYSIANFFRMRFYILNNELILESGVFNRKKTIIPFEKIQTINFEQNIVHRFFSVTRLKIDTAGSVKNEFEFHAIDEEKASALRDLLIAGKKESIKYSELKESEDTAEASPALIEYTPVMTLDQWSLLKVGITENHLKSGGLIIIFFLWIFQSMEEVGLDVDDYSGEVDKLEMSIAAGLILMFLFLLASFIISLVRTVVNYYDLRMMRSAHGFKIESGLLTRKAVSALDHKIQQIGWSDNLLRKLVGYKNLYLKQASSELVRSRQTAKIPGCSKDHIISVVQSLYGNNRLFDMDMKMVDFRYFLRRVIILSVLGVMLALLLYFLNFMAYIWIIPMVLVYLTITRYIAWKKLKYGFDDELLRVEGGIYGDKAEILPIYKIQAVELHSTIYQRQYRLTDLIVYTAAGRVKIPYIPLDTGRQLLNLFIYKTETDKRKWM